MYKNEPIFLQPTFHERIWGGSKLKAEFQYPIPSEKTGEAWVISAHPHGPSTITNGELKGKTLLDAWNDHGELFNRKDGKKGEYPLLVKILDANYDLSVQVHPDDEFARKVENEPYGKTECWYVLSAEEDAELILGHHAETEEEFDRMVENGEWDKLLRRVKVKAGDFFYVPSGAIHAIGKGTVILETQQSSDITYRVYDYDRVDANGNKRELHLDKARQVTNIPHEDVKTEKKVTTTGGLTETMLIDEQYFTVYHWNLDGETTKDLTGDFLQVSVIDGQADLLLGGNRFELKKGMNFILPYGTEEFRLEGKAQLIVSHP